MDEAALEVDDQIRSNRSRDMPCFCDATIGTELTDVTRSGTQRIEHVRCGSCRLRWKRIWVGRQVD